MALFPNPSAPVARPELEQKADIGPWGGPTYSYRGARIECCRNGHVCGLQMEGHPLGGRTFRTASTITPLIDLWVEEKRLPGYMRAVTPAARGLPRPLP